MKLLQKIATALACIIFLILLFVIFCIVNPDIARSLGVKIHQLTARQDEVMEQTEESGLINELEQEVEAAIGESVAKIEITFTPYETPSENNLSVDGKLQDRTGLIPLTEEVTEVEAGRQDEIALYLGYGETGENLTFSLIYYPYYAMLDEDEQAVYRQIYANAQVGNEAFAPVSGINQSKLSDVIMAVTGDHPEIFWLECGYRCQIVPSGQVAEIELLFNECAKQLERSKKDFEAAVEELLAQVENLEDGSTALDETQRRLHDVLLAHVEYNSGAPLNQSAYSALVNRETVCAGYAKAYQVLCQRCDIPCYYCTGYAGEDHAWNIVRLKEEYYNVDVTWDDAVQDPYLYFNKTDQDYAADHIRRNLSVYLPACNGETYRLVEEDEIVEESVAEGAPLDSLEFDPNSYYGYGDDHTLRKLQDIGFSQSDVKTTLKEYYDSCYELIVTGTGHTRQFQIVVSDYQLMEDIYNSYVNHSYEAGYGTRALNELQAASWSMKVDIEAIQGDYYLISHTMTY